MDSPINIARNIHFVPGNQFSGNEYQLIIFDFTGRKCKEMNNLTTDNITINLNGFNNGIYFYKFTNNENKVFTGKFIVQ